MIPEAAAWLIMILPLLSFGLIGLVVRPFLDRYRIASGWLTIGAVAASLLLSLWALISVMAEGGPIDYGTRQWIAVPGLLISFGILMDPLTAIMLVVVGGVSLMVQVYSQGYMRGDPGYSRYFAFMSLFTASMLGLVLARNVVQLFVFWELVGVSSYLLIGFWFRRPAAAAAAKKAFLVTRVGDLGLLIGILYLFSQGNELLDLPTLYQAAAAGMIAVSVATWVALGVLLGAIGKSAQLPLHTWLPDAMEGPTPVSALIHSATMVTAGVFLVARFFPLFDLSIGAMTTVALVGGLTAILAASMALVAVDIKRVLAYSTISQLGYMMLALGVGAYVPAIFHLFTHAFFKALLFLGAGSVNHATGTFDMRYMGGLRKVMPWTYGMMMIGSLSLAGVFPLAGFWSKDEILAATVEAGTLTGLVVFLLALTAVVMTAFYMFRALFLTFHGAFRGGVEAEMRAIEGAGGEPAGQHGEIHLGESPAVMLAPMVPLAVFAVIIGIAVNPVVDLGIVAQHALGGFLTSNPAVFTTPAAVELAGAHPPFLIGLAIGSTLLALAGIGIAWLMYDRGVIDPAGLRRQFPSVHRLLERRWYFDELYEDLLVRRWFYGRAAWTLDWIDKYWIDNVNVRITGWTGSLGRGLTQLQNGQTQAYALAIAAGILVTIAAFLIWGA